MICSRIARRAATVLVGAAFTVVCAVLASLLLALTYVPAMSAWLLRQVHERPSCWQEALRAAYRRSLDRVLANGRLVVGVAAVVVVAAVASLAGIGTEFMPKLDEGSILINTRRLPGVSLEDATRLSLQAERIVRRFPEVVTVVTKEGRPDLATEAMGLFEGDMYVILKPRGEWTTGRDNDELIAAFDSALAVIPGLWVSFTQPLAMRLDEAESGIRTDLGIKVVGPDIAHNPAAAERVRRIVAGVPGAADVAVEVSEGSGQIRMDVRRDALARHGASVADVRDAVDLALRARAATEILDGARRIEVAVRLPDSVPDDVAELERLTARTPTGGLVPLGELVDIVSTTAPELIGHEDAQRRTLVLANVRGRDLGGFVQDVRDRMEREVTRSVPQSALVLLNVPFAFVGAIAMLWARGPNLSLSASVGFIALFGIAVLNGVVLVSHLNALLEDGVPLDDAVRAGAADRLRPVLMTALVASLGFVPMALSTSPGSEVQRPLASVVIGGLISSTVLTLFVLPVLYRALARRQARHADDSDEQFESVVPTPTAVVVS